MLGRRAVARRTDSILRARLFPRPGTRAASETRSRRELARPDRSATIPPLAFAVAPPPASRRSASATSPDWVYADSACPPAPSPRRRSAAPTPRLRGAACRCRGFESFVERQVIRHRAPRDEDAEGSGQGAEDPGYKRSCWRRSSASPCRPRRRGCRSQEVHGHTREHAAQPLPQ